ncbi:MAG: hypothetical protein D3923_16860 [Candidatus Electrothrix sp. AR3]|nr:hypothetical protein [Candidatus Electrothrix sp. AR3]
MKNKTLPICCCNCQKLVSTPFFSGDVVHHSCSRNIIFPVKSGKCKAQTRKINPTYGNLKNKDNSRTKQLSIFEVTA